MAKNLAKIFFAFVIFVFLIHTAAADCSDGTLEGTCSTTKPLKCVSGTLVPDAATCGCPTPTVPDGNTCVIPGIGTGKCADSTTSGSCSTTYQGFFCQSGALIPGCSNGCCPTLDYGFGYSPSVCDQSNVCLKRCSDNTPVGQCSPNFQGYKCVLGSLVNDCTVCGCPSGSTCTTVGTGPAAEQACKPNPVDSSIPDSCNVTATNSGQCASESWYCDNSTVTPNPSCSGIFCLLHPTLCTALHCFNLGTLKPGCSNSCCPPNSICDANNLCKPAGNCADGTPSGGNSSTYPGWVCVNGQLQPSCSTTTCPADYICYASPSNLAAICSSTGSTGACSSPLSSAYAEAANTCWPTGTSGSCNGVADGSCAPAPYEGYKCTGGNLVSDCRNCPPCPAGFSCNPLDDVCHPNNTPCPDGTFTGACNAVGEYCDGTTSPPSLVPSCADPSHMCACPANYTCDSTTNQCKPQFCLSDGTSLKACSNLNKGFYCNSAGTLVPSCADPSHTCACASGFTCDSGTGTCIRNACQDSSALNSCSTTNQGYYCNSYGNLVLDCSKCTCSGVNSCSGVLVGMVQQLGTSEFAPLYGVVMFIVLLSLGAVVMFGYATQNPRHIARAKIELYQMIVTIGMGSIVVIATLTLCTFVSQFGFNSPILGATAYMQNLAAQAEAQTRNLITASIQNQLKATDWEFTPTFWSALLGVPGGHGEGKYAYLRAVSQSQEIMIDILLPLMASLNVQLVALSMINQFAIQLLIPFGILLRIIPPTRQAGDFLLAAAVGIYIVFPMTYVLNSYVYSNFIASAPSLSFGMDSNIDFTGIGSLLPQAIFFPNLSIVITISFIMSFHRLINEVSSLMERYTGYTMGGNQGALW